MAEVRRKQPRAAVHDAWDALSHGSKNLSRLRDSLVEINPELSRVMDEISQLLTQEQFDVLRDAELVLIALEQSMRPNMRDWAYLIDLDKGEFRRRRRGAPGDAKQRAMRGLAAAIQVEDLIIEGRSRKAAVSMVAERFEIGTTEVAEYIAIYRGKKPLPSHLRMAFGKHRRHMSPK